MAAGNKDLRNICLNMLISTLEEGKLSGNVLNDTFRTEKLDKNERSFVKRLYTGVLEKLIYLDHEADLFSDIRVRKMKKVIRNILRMGIYQLRFMDSVPAYSVINESVKLTRKRGFNNLCPFVNAVLRKAQDIKEEPELPENVKALVPEWLYILLNDQYGKEKAGAFFEALKKERTEIFVRFNLNRGSREDIMDRLVRQHIQVREIPLDKYGAPSTDSSFAYGIKNFDSLTQLDVFKDGSIFVQDPGAMLCILAGVKYIEKNTLTIDVCAAPGGKSLMMAQLFPEARIISADLTEKKVSLIRENIKRLDVSQIEPVCADARAEDRDLREKADVVIADLPCSGLGVAGKKPDILYRLKESDLKQLKSLQKQILSVCSTYVRPGGLLIYSTCTVNRSENEDNAVWFSDNFGFEFLEDRLLLPGEWEYDGFYYAYFRKQHKNGGKD